MTCRRENELFEREYIRHLVSCQTFGSIFSILTIK
jgi:hypothetical protein